MNLLIAALKSILTVLKERPITIVFLKISTYMIKFYFSFTLCKIILRKLTDDSVKYILK